MDTLQPQQRHVMKTNELEEALDALKALPPRTLTARLRAIYPAIEAKRAAGIQHAAILEALNRAGWNISAASYKGIIARIRKEPKKSAIPASVAESPPPKPSALPSSGTVVTVPQPTSRAERDAFAASIVPDQSGSILSRIKKEPKQ